MTAFAAVREGIGEWRELLFEPMSMPEFDRDAFVPSFVVATEDSEIRFFDRIKNSFGAFPVWTAAPAMGLLIIGFGVFYFSAAFQNADSIAVNAPGQIDQNLPDIQINEPQTAANEEEQFVDEVERNTVQSSPKVDRVEKASLPAKSSHAKKRPVKTIQVPETPVNEPQVQAVKEIPKLTNFAEYEDDSIRLSDLFDEVGSR